MPEAYCELKQLRLSMDVLNCALYVVCSYHLSLHVAASATVVLFTACAVQLRTSAACKWNFQLNTCMAECPPGCDKG